MWRAKHMLKLMKYELRKTWFIKLILLGVTAVAEIIFLIGLYGRYEDTLAVGTFLLFLLAFCGLTVIGIASVVVLHRDMNTRQGYMLFMTPNSCYKILGAKVLECGISILLAGAFFFALGALDVSLVFARQGMLNLMWQRIQETLSHMTFAGRPIQLNLSVYIALGFSILASWFSTVMTAYLADVISSALLNGKKFNGLISFLIFIALSWGLGKLIALAVDGIRNIVPYLWVYSLCSLAVAAVMYWITARIMEKHLSV